MYDDLGLNGVLLDEVLKDNGFVSQLGLAQQLVVPYLDVHLLLAQFVEGAPELDAFVYVRPMGQLLVLIDRGEDSRLDGFLGEDGDLHLGVDVELLVLLLL